MRQKRIKRQMLIGIISILMIGSRVVEASSVKSEGNIQFYEVENETKPSDKFLPRTGEKRSKNILTTMGILTMVGGYIIILYKKKE